MIPDEKLNLLFSELVAHYPFLDLPMIFHRALPDFNSTLYNDLAVTPRRMQNVRLHLVNAYRGLFPERFELTPSFETTPVAAQEFVGFVLMMASYGYSIPLMIGQMTRDAAVQLEWLRKPRTPDAQYDAALNQYDRLVALDSWFGQEIGRLLRPQWLVYAQHEYPYVNLTKETA